MDSHTPTAPAGVVAPPGGSVVGAFVAVVVDVVDVVALEVVVGVGVVVGMGAVIEVTVGPVRVVGSPPGEG